MIDSLSLCLVLDRIIRYYASYSHASTNVFMSTDSRMGLAQDVILFLLQRLSHARFERDCIFVRFASEYLGIWINLHLLFQTIIKVDNSLLPITAKIYLIDFLTRIQAYEPSVFSNLFVCYFILSPSQWRYNVTFLSIHFAFVYFA